MDFWFDDGHRGLHYNDFKRIDSKDYFIHCLPFLRLEIKVQWCRRKAEMGGFAGDGTGISGRLLTFLGMILYIKAAYGSKVDSGMWVTPEASDFYWMGFLGLLKLLTSFFVANWIQSEFNF